LIDLEAFSNKVNEWAELTIGHTLQRSLINHLYDRFRDFDQDTVLKCIESCIMEGLQPSFKALWDKYRPMKQTRSTGPSRAIKQVLIRVEECNERECHLCDEVECGEMERILPKLIDRLMTSEHHDNAWESIQKEFPNIDWYELKKKRSKEQEELKKLYER
jgi:hypothetical protein